MFNENHFRYSTVNTSVTLLYRIYRSVTSNEAIACLLHVARSAASYQCRVFRPVWGVYRSRSVVPDHHSCTHDGRSSPTGPRSVVSITVGSIDRKRTQLNLPQCVADCERRANTPTKDLVLANSRLCRQVESAMNKYRTRSVKNSAAPPKAGDDEDCSSLLASAQGAPAGTVGEQTAGARRGATWSANGRRAAQLTKIMRAAQVNWFRIQVARARIAKVDSNRSIRQIGYKQRLVSVTALATTLDNKARKSWRKELWFVHRPDHVTGDTYI